MVPGKHANPIHKDNDYKYSPEPVEPLCRTVSLSLLTTLPVAIS